MSKKETRVRIISGDWAGLEGRLIDRLIGGEGEYEFEGRNVKLDPQHPDDEDAYVEVYMDDLQIIGEGGS